jgi:hypothetical protein
MIMIPWCRFDDDDDDDDADAKHSVNYDLFYEEGLGFRCVIIIESRWMVVEMCCMSSSKRCVSLLL